MDDEISIDTESVGLSTEKNGMEFENVKVITASRYFQMAPQENRTQCVYCDSILPEMK